MRHELRKMIDNIVDDSFDEAREHLKVVLAQYLAGKRFVTNKEIFGDGSDPRDDYSDEGYVINDYNDGYDDDFDEDDFEDEVPARCMR